MSQGRFRERLDDAVLIAALSGRSLAQSARRAGFKPLVADMFADRDMRETAADFRIVDGDIVDGFDPGALIAALEELAAGSVPIGIVCGPGFERSPDLVDEIAERWRLLGNGGATIRALKDPLGFAALCSRLAIRHPETRRRPPETDSGGEWLVKRAGASGGGHVTFFCDDSGGEAQDRYFQKLTHGERRSALFVASAGKAVVLGLTEQWTSPAKGQPFRYGGACGPVDVSSYADVAMRNSIGRLATALPELVGLCSADFLVDDNEEPALLEINPRPGATLDVFDDDEAPLLARHIDACNGRLPQPICSQVGPIRAAGIVYSDWTEKTIGALDWPDHASDLPMPGVTMRFGEPICTVKSDGADARQAMTAFDERVVRLKNKIEDASS